MPSKTPCRLCRLCRFFFSLPATAPLAPHTPDHTPHAPQPAHCRSLAWRKLGNQGPAQTRPDQNPHRRLAFVAYSSREEWDISCFSHETSPPVPSFHRTQSRGNHAATTRQPRGNHAAIMRQSCGNHAAEPSPATGQNSLLPGPGWVPPSTKHQTPPLPTCPCAPNPGAAASYIMPTRQWTVPQGHGYRC